MPLLRSRTAVPRAAPNRVGKIQPSIAVPSSIPTLGLWYPATSIGIPDGAAVANWPDASGNGFPLLQATGASQPTFVRSQLNQLPIVRFAGIDDYMATAAFAWAQPVTIVIVARYTSAFDGSHRGLTDGFPGSYSLFSYRSSSTGMAMYDSGSGFGSSAVTPENWHVWTFVHNGASSIMRMDGVQVGAGDPGNVALAGFTIAGTENPAVDVAEAVVYESLLAPADMAAVEEYLRYRFFVQQIGSRDAFVTVRFSAATVGFRQGGPASAKMRFGAVSGPTKKTALGAASALFPSDFVLLGPAVLPRSNVITRFKATTTGARAQAGAVVAVTARSVISVTAVKNAKAAVAVVSARPVVAVTSQKGARGSVIGSARCITSASTRKGALALSLLSARSVTSVTNLKGARSSTLTTAQIVTSATGTAAANRGSSAHVTARAILVASGQKGARAATNTTAQAVTVTTIRKGAQATTQLQARPITTVVVRKGGASASLLSAHAVTTTAGNKGARGSTVVPAQVILTVTGGKPATAAVLISTIAVISCLGKKGAVGVSGTMSAHAQTSTTTRHGSVGSVNLIAHIVTSAVGKHGGLSSPLLTSQSLIFTTGRKSARSSTFITSQPIITTAVPKHATGSATVTGRVVLQLTTFAATASLPVFPVNMMGYIEQAKTGQLARADTGRLEGPTTGKVK